jgi:hypothetical protein
MLENDNRVNILIMVLGIEKVPKSQQAQERPESLIFNSREQVGKFIERLEKRKSKDGRKGVRRDREFVADELAQEIEKQGEEVIDTSRPWEHSPEEHREVQNLVETAFREDLVLALKKMRKSPNYPRLVDLFHDVLTDQMYEALVRAGINKQKIGKGTWWMVGLAFILLLIAFALLVGWL